MTNNLKTVTREQQISELTSRVPPVLNVDIVIHKDGKYLFGKRNSINAINNEHILFPGGRAHFDETPVETAERILATEVPGIRAIVRKLITAIPDKGHDSRAYNVILYYLLDFLDGDVSKSPAFDSFIWLSLDEAADQPDMYPMEKMILKEIQQTLLLMNTNEDEQLVEIDDNGNEIGVINKRVAHITPSRCHQSAMILVFNTAGGVILHQRSQYKSASPLKWDVFGGHQPVGLTIEQTAEHELLEELGIRTPITFMKLYWYRDTKQCELQYVYMTVCDGPYAYDRNEVAQIKAFDCRRLIHGDYDADHNILSHVKKFVSDYLQK